jgi:cytochrome c oxidase assembly factor CtaG
MEPITAHFNWTADDLIKGRKYFLKSRGKSPYLIILLCFVAGLIGWQLTTANHSLNASSAIAAAVVVALLLLGCLIGIPVSKSITRYLTRREFAKRPDANIAISWTFAEDLIHTLSSSGKAEIQWSAFQSVLHTPAGFLFIPNRQMFHLIPTRAFANPAEIENLKSLARRQAAEYKEIS